MNFTNLFSINLLAKTIIIEEEFYCPSFERGTSNYVAEGVGFKLLYKCFYTVDDVNTGSADVLNTAACKVIDL